MANPITYAGAQLAICTTAQNDEIGDASPGFAGLTYVDIGNVGNIGEYGYNTNMVSYSTLTRAILLKAKGQTDGGNFSFEVAVDTTDAGQIACDVAADPLSGDNFAFRITFADGAIHYIRGPVGGPNFPGGGNEEFVRAAYMIGVNEIYKVPAP
jgi:hypothetical protein